MNARKTKLDPRTAYNYGVRCPATRAANADYFRRWYAMKKMQAARRPLQLILAGL